MLRRVFVLYFHPCWLADIVICHRIDLFRVYFLLVLLCWELSDFFCPAVTLGSEERRGWWEWKRKIKCGAQEDTFFLCDRKGACAGAWVIATVHVSIKQAHHFWSLIENPFFFYGTRDAVLGLLSPLGMVSWQTCAFFPCLSPPPPFLHVHHRFNVW